VILAGFLARILSPPTRRPAQRPPVSAIVVGGKS
jgi:hypothetical protein